MARINISWGDKWDYEYEGYKITVRNKFDVCQLLVDGKVQDAHNGLTLSTNLTGKLPNGKQIKATVGGLWVMKCSVFVEHELLKAVRHE